MIWYYQRHGTYEVHRLYTRMVNLRDGVRDIFLRTCVAERIMSIMGEGK